MLTLEREFNNKIFHVIEEKYVFVIINPYFNGHIISKVAFANTMVKFTRIPSSCSVFRKLYLTFMRLNGEYP